MKYKIVTMVDGIMIAQEPKNIEFWAEVCGVEITGHKNGHPVLKDFAGPMLDADFIRYESFEVYNILSV